MPELTTCAGGVVATAVTSDQPEITSWFFGPVLTEFDEFGTITTVVPLGGQAARNDGPDGVDSQPAGVGWEQLALVHGPTRSNLPEWAVSTEQYASIRATFREELGVELAGGIDFSSSVVFAFSRPTGSCPIRLDAVDIEPSSRVTPRFDTTDTEQCRAMLVTSTWLVRMDRDRLPDVVNLPAQTGMAGALDWLAVDLTDGTLIEGGLVIAFPPRVDCVAGNVVVSAPVDSAGPRAVEAWLMVDGTNVAQMSIAHSGETTWIELPVSGAELSGQTWVSVASTDPPAEDSASLTGFQSAIDELIAGCG